MPTDRRARVISVLVPTTAILIAVGVVAWCYWCIIRPEQLFFAEKWEIDDILESMRKQVPPEGVDPHIWDDAWIGISIAFANACFSIHEVPLDEMRRLHKDILEHAATNQSFEFMCWLWRRLAECSPSAREYIERFTPNFELTGEWLDKTGDGKRHGFKIER